MLSKFFYLISLILLLNLALPSLTLAQTSPVCKDIGYIFDTRPSPPIAGQDMWLNFRSSEIKTGNDYYVKIRKESTTTGKTEMEFATLPAGGDGSIAITSPELRKLQPGTYRVQFYIQDRPEVAGIKLPPRQVFKCITDPFEIKALNPPPVENSCSVTVQIINNQIRISGNGTLKTGEYRAYVTRADGGTTPLLGGNLTVNDEGSFGPKDYAPPVNYQGGDTTIGVMHTFDTLVRCQTTTTLPNTTNPPQYNSWSCGGAGQPACTSAKGVPCTNGVLTAIGCVPTEPASLIKGLIKVAAAAGGGIALLLMGFGAIQMMISQGTPEGIKAGQERLTSAALGLLFILFSVVLLRIIGVDILKLPGFIP